MAAKKQKERQSFFDFFKMTNASIRTKENHQCYVDKQRLDLTSCRYTKERAFKRSDNCFIFIFWNIHFVIG